MGGHGWMGMGGHRSCMCGHGWAWVHFKTKMLISGPDPEAPEGSRRGPAPLSQGGRPLGLRDPEGVSPQPVGAPTDLGHRIVPELRSGDVVPSGRRLPARESLGHTSLLRQSA